VTDSTQHHEGKEDGRPLIQAELPDQEADDKKEDIKGDTERESKE
jgi:hypothetical protein